MGQFSEAFRKVQKSISASAGRVFEDDSMTNARAMTAALSQGASARRSEENPDLLASSIEQMATALEKGNAAQQSREALSTSIDQMKTAIGAPSGSTATSEKLTQSIERLRSTMDLLLKEELAKREKLRADKLWKKKQDEGKDRKQKSSLLAKLKMLTPLGIASGVGLALGKWGESKFADQERLRRYDARITQAFALLERNQVLIDVEKAGKTGKTTLRAAKAKAGADKALVNFNSDMTNLGNQLYEALLDVKETTGRFYDVFTGRADERDKKPAGGPMPKEFFDAFRDIAKIGNLEPMPPRPAAPPPRHE